MKKVAMVAMIVASVLSFSAVSAFAKTKPTVVIIRATWCGYCQKLEPAMMDLMKQYDGKLKFVILDVTDEASTAKAEATARSLGIAKFFEANKKTTSTVAIFKGTRQVFKTAMNTDRDDYVAAFNNALK